MASHLGPEKPMPLCVQSEQSLLDDKNIFVKFNQFKERLKSESIAWNETEYVDEKTYERQIFFTINKYLDIDCPDDILYVCPTSDDTHSNWPRIIERKFCLFNPVEVAHLRHTKDSRVVICGNTAGKKYDKIIIKNCLKYFQNDEKYFCEYIVDFFKSKIQTKTSLLIVQRVSDLNTLPFSSRVMQEWQSNDIEYTRLMRRLQAEFYSVKYDIETIKFMIDCKSNWYTDMKHNRHYPLNQRGHIVGKTNDSTYVNEVRELNEGVFKYHQVTNYVEMADRLLFIGAHHEVDRQALLIERINYGKNVDEPCTDKGDDDFDKHMKKLHLEITPDVKTLLNSMKVKKY